MWLLEHPKHLTLAAAVAAGGAAHTRIDAHTDHERARTESPNAGYATSVTKPYAPVVGMDSDPNGGRPTVIG